MSKFNCFIIGAVIGAYVVCPLSFGDCLMSGAESVALVGAVVVTIVAWQFYVIDGNPLP